MVWLRWLIGAGIVALVGVALLFWVNPLRLSPKWAPYYRLLDSVDRGDLASATAEIDAGTAPNAFPRGGEEDIAVLCVAADHGDKAMVQMLLDHKADPNIRDGWNYNPLTAASIHNHLDVMQVLLDHGALVNESEGDSIALWRAAIEDKAPAVIFLLHHGANPNSHFSGSSLLNAVEDSRHIDVAKILEHAGAKG